MKDASRAITLLIDEAWKCIAEGRYADGLAAAERAVEGARQLGDLTLQVRAADAEGDCLRMLGDHAAALVRYTWVLGVAQDPRRRGELRAAADVSWEVAKAYMNWVVIARSLPEMPASKLFEVLDAGEAWLRAVGHVDWRAGLLSERAELSRMSGHHDEAIAYLQEAVALHRPNTPGYTLSTYLWSLGDALRAVNRVDEAQAAYEQAYEKASGPFSRQAALQGLAQAALERGDVTLARGHIEKAVQLAESMGDETLSISLEVLVEVERAAHDTAAAWATVERLLPLRRRVGGSRTYWALRAAVDVALDRGDVVSARQYLAEATPFAQALDRQRGGTAFENELDYRRRRLEALDSAS
jgi:tetratricopeptide (TPR) repeat protein